MGVVSRRDGSKGAMDGTVEDFVENKEEEGEGGDCFSVAEGWIRSSFERKEGRKMSKEPLETSYSPDEGWR